MAANREGRSDQGRRYLPPIVLLVVFVALCAAIPWLDEHRLSEQAAGIIKALIWPFFIIAVVLLFQKEVEDLLSRITKLVISPEKAEFIIGISNVPVPLGEQDISLDNVALLHTSFLRPDKTKEFNDGLTYYQVEIIVLARDPALDRIEAVTYHLAEPYPVRKYVIENRDSKFKLKELANGASIIRAEVKIRGRDEPLSLNRFMDLQAAGPRI